MNTLKELRKVNEKRSLEGFGLKLTDWSLPEWGCAIAGEVGEMCNIIKKIHRGDFRNNQEEGIQKLQSEIADIIIYLDLIASREHIDLEKAIISKFNEVSDRMNCPIKIKYESEKPFVSNLDTEYPPEYTFGKGLRKREPLGDKLM